MKKNYLFIVAGLILFIFMQNIFAQGFHDRKRDHVKFNMMERLNLTEDQQSQIEEMKIAHQKEMINLKSNLEMKELELKELTGNRNYSRSDYVAKVKAISDAKDEIALSMANHQMDIYEILDDAQKKDWDESLPMMMGKFHNKKDFGKFDKRSDRDRF